MTTVDYINNPFDPPSKPILTNTKQELIVDNINTPALNSQDISYTLDQPKYKLDTDTTSPISPISSTSASLSSSLSTASSARSPSGRKRYSDFSCHCLHHHRPLSTITSHSRMSPTFHRRYTTSAAELNDCILPDTTVEGRPSVFLFIFVNPLSGDQQGNDLIELPVQQFRLRRRPYVKVEIHNILDAQDRQDGFEHILWIQNMVRQHQLPPLPATHHRSDCQQKNQSCACFETPTALSRHIHVYSAGGDGTVMSVFDALTQYKIDSSLFFFSCVPFGTGNDFSQVLGWGRTTKQKDILGSRLAHLENLILERLDHGEPARLDIWQLAMKSHPTGYVCRAGKSDNTTTCIERKMCSYVSIGLQGYVGSGFEQRRAGRRWANIWAYTVEGAKWLFYRKFPPVTRFISRIVSMDNEAILLSMDQHDKDPTITKHPIELVIQNIPHIWGRQIDLWGSGSTSGLEIVKDRHGPTDPSLWHPQRANDGYLEIMALGSIFSYIKKLANFRNHVSRIGQFGQPFKIEFKPPHQQAQKKFINQYERDNIICIMCDGEFYQVKDPKEISIQRFGQIWTLGDKHQSRLVRDEIQFPDIPSNS